MIPLDYINYVPGLPAVAAVLCGVCCMKRGLRVLAAPICILALAGAFLLTFFCLRGVHAQQDVPPLWEWMNIGGFQASMGYFIDPLTRVMLLVVTGIGTLVAIYAAGYMAGDRGYARFFAGVSLFIFAMTTLVMADNLVLLYLGWEGVGLCSYLLIGYYYEKPSAVAAAKKAFIVNRIGDLGFALGIFLTFYKYGSVQFADIFAVAGHAEQTDWVDHLIPFLLMLGAFGKSAQLPLYVWLPDAMEGPTPVSALIHAATMVTAGVYMIARLLPLFVLSPYALPTVAIVGAATALFAATIALCQYDIKRIYAYSTISQLGYMFLAVGVLSTVGGVFHLFTHAFFKALLFLTAGSVMHGLAGQLDLRKMSGLGTKMPVTCVLMLIGCLALAGFPFTSGFFSKDMILAATMERGIGEHGQWLYLVLAFVGMFTALLTAYYTFRLWFRVFLGPTEYEMGQEHHDAESQALDAKSDHVEVEHVHDAHEVSPLMNAPLVVLALGSLLAGVFGVGWMTRMIAGSTAAVHPEAGHAHLNILGWHPTVHLFMMIASSVIALTGIALAAYFHWLNRAAADRAADRFPAVVRTLANKYYVDEFYDRVIVQPLRLAGEIFYLIDRMIVDGLVATVGFVPRLFGLTAQPMQRGLLQGYGFGMIAGVALILLIVLLARL